MKQIKKVYQITNLLEDEDEYLVSGNIVKLQIRPFEIKTLKLKRK